MKYFIYEVYLKSRDYDIDESKPYGAILAVGSYDEFAKSKWGGLYRVKKVSVVKGGYVFKNGGPPLELAEIRQKVKVHHHSGSLNLGKRCDLRGTIIGGSAKEKILQLQNSGEIYEEIHHFLQLPKRRI